jgi:SAM-dependent methyltransferase
MAHRADKHALYERAVQDPVSEVEFVARTFRRVRDRPALTLREDFCGTGVFALQWARSRRDRRAWGIDLDRRTLDWGREHRLAHAEAHVVDRVELIQGDVLQGLGPTVDVACAFNFSYWTFKTRERLRQYFRIVRRRLADDGMFFLDVMGGVEVPTPDETRRSLGDFVYRWEQASFNPLTNELVCHIHFEFPDGSALSRAFTYDWRLWSIPELRELLLEAGFRRVHVYWEKTDAAGRGTGGFYQPERVHNDDLWWTYISAER